MDEQMEIELAIRSERHATLVCDDTPHELKTVIDNPSGDLVFPVHSSVFDSGETVLWLPEERRDAMQVLVELVEVDGSNAESADRWRIYHGDPDETCWAHAKLLAVRFGSLIADGSDLDLSNPLAKDEPSICKHFNKDPGELGLIAAQLDPRSSGDGLLVGVDPLGIDIRTRFDIVRVPFGDAVTDGEAARGRIAQLLDELRGHPA